jgi:hypothetical protein
MRGGKERVGRDKGWGGRGSKRLGEGKGQGKGRGGEEGGRLHPPNFETVVAPLFMSISRRHQCERRH